MNGETFLLFTTEEGGYFQVRRFSESQYEDVLRDGAFKDLYPEGVEEVHPAFVALMRVERNFDFLLQRSR